VQLDYLHVRAGVKYEEADYRVPVFCLRQENFEFSGIQTGPNRLSPNAGISNIHTYIHTRHEQRVMNSYTTYVSTAPQYSETLHDAVVSASTFTQTSNFCYLISFPPIKNHDTNSSYYSVLPKPLQIHGSPIILLSALQSAIQTTQNLSCTHSEFLSSFYFASSILLSSSSVSNYSAHNSLPVKNLSFTISGKNVCYYMKSNNKVSPPSHTHTHTPYIHTHTHTHTHTQSQSGQVSLKTTPSFRFHVQKHLPDWKKRVFYVHFYSGYAEQETLSSHVSFNLRSITTALRGSLHYTPIRTRTAVNGYNHSENRPAMPDLLLTAHSNNPDE